MSRPLWESELEVAHVLLLVLLGEAVQVIVVEDSVVRLFDVILVGHGGLGYGETGRATRRRSQR